MFELSRDIWTEPGCLNWDMMFELRHDVWTEPGCLNWVGMFELSRDVEIKWSFTVPIWWNIHYKNNSKDLFIIWIVYHAQTLPQDVHFNFELLKLFYLVFSDIQQDANTKYLRLHIKIYLSFISCFFHSFTKQYCHQHRLVSDYMLPCWISQIIIPIGMVIWNQIFCLPLNSTNSNLS